MTQWVERLLGMHEVIQHLMNWVALPIIPHCGGRGIRLSLTTIESLKYETESTYLG